MLRALQVIRSAPLGAGRRRAVCAVLAAVAGLWLFLARSLEAGPNWPQFRGPGARGVSDDESVPDTWSREDNVSWSVDIPGRGWSSPVVWGDHVIVTTVSSQGPVEEAKKGLYFGGNRSKPPPHDHEWIVMALDAETGKPRWKRVARKARPDQPNHIKNTDASETPVTDGERVHAYFGTAGVFTYDMNGKPLWSKIVKARKMRYGWGTAASPVLHDGRLYIVYDNDEDSFAMALDAETGKEIWRKARDEKSNWATPYIWEHSLRTELVTPGSGKVRSYSLDGEVLWELRGMSVITIPTPFAGHGMLYISSGYVLDKLKPIYAIRPGASGDISLQEDETSNAYVAWSDMRAGPYNPSPLLLGDHLYTLFDRGFLGCRKARTGEVVYRKRRLSRAANAFTASPWSHGGKIFCLSEDGDTYVIRPGAEFEVLHVNSLGEMCMATPAIAAGRLFIRTASRLYCIEDAK